MDTPLPPLFGIFLGGSSTIIYLHIHTHLHVGMRTSLSVAVLSNIACFCCTQNSSWFGHGLVAQVHFVFFCPPPPKSSTRMVFRFVCSVLLITAFNSSFSWFFFSLEETIPIFFLRCFQFWFVICNTLLYRLVMNWSKGMIWTGWSTHRQSNWTR